MATQRQTTPITISAKNLGELALPNCCDRCVWLKLKMGHKLPYQIFPGIFSSIDAYTKNIVHDHFDRHYAAPAWLSALGELTGYLNPPHWSKFTMLDEKYQIVLRGTPDGILVRSDQRLVILDYKTARFTDLQDQLLPMYRVQLNVYAAIAESLGMGSVGSLALVYMQPATDPAVDLDGRCLRDGFDMGFKAHIVDIELDREMINPLVARARGLFDAPKQPPKPSNCKNCDSIGAMRRLLAS